MKCFKLLPVAIALIPMGQAFADPSTTNFVPGFTQVSRIVNSLHPDKPAQARVSAFDGSEFSGGQALWLKAQLRQVEMAATQGNQGEAMTAVQQIAVVLKEHGAQIDTGALLARSSKHQAE